MPTRLAKPARCASVIVLLGITVLLPSLAAQSPPAVPDATALRFFEEAVEVRRKGDSIGARPLVEQAIEHATKAGDRAMLQRSLNLMAELRGDFSDWVGMLDYAERGYAALPDPKGQAHGRYLLMRGRVLQELRERDQALAAYHEGLEIAKAVGDLGAEGSFYNELGLMAWRFDRDREKALQYYEASYQVDVRRKHYRNQAVSWNNSGNLFRFPGLWHEAERRYRAGLAALKRGGIDKDAMLFKNLAIVLRETGRRAEAEAMLLEAVELADTGGIGRTQWQARMELGTLYSGHDVDKASRYFEETLKVLEGQNNNVLLEGFRSGALSGAVTIQDDPYDLYTDLLLAHGRPEDAFLIAERARARAFLDTLSLAREAIAAALPEAFVREEREILERISATQARLRTPDAGAALRDEWRRSIAADEENLARLRLRLASDHPGLADARYPKLWSVGEIQSKLLQGDEVLLQYFLGAQAGTLWIVTPRSLQVHALPPRAEIETAVRGYLETLSTPEGRFADAALSLGAMLLPGLDRAVSESSRLLVVPHGILNYLPFEALRTPRERFLVEEHPLSYAPSSSSLAFLRSRGVSGAEVLALGNPVLRAGAAGAERGRGAERVDLLKPLPHSGTEVQALSAVYRGAARVFQQDEATEAVLRGDAVNRAGIIHIATHGLIDEELPDRSGLALTAAPPLSDGILQMREVYGLRLNASLVTLSACQTALGKAVTGEGMVGLSRAFFYAGANAVLASLWNVNDVSTERLMKPFYESLSSGAAIDVALRSAKLALLRSGGKLEHPYYWAPFVVSGHGTVAIGIRPGAALTDRLLWATGVTVALMMMAGAIAARRRVR